MRIWSTLLEHIIHFLVPLHSSCFIIRYSSPSSSNSVRLEASQWGRHYRKRSQNGCRGFPSYHKNNITVMTANRLQFRLYGSSSSRYYLMALHFTAWDSLIMVCLHIGLIHAKRSVIKWHCSNPKSPCRLVCLDESFPIAPRPGLTASIDIRSGWRYIVRSVTACPSPSDRKSNVRPFAKAFAYTELSSLIEVRFGTLRFMWYNGPSRASIVVS